MPFSPFPTQTPIPPLPPMRHPMFVLNKPTGPPMLAKNLLSPFPSLLQHRPFRMMPRDSFRGLVTPYPNLSMPLGTSSARHLIGQRGNSHTCLGLLLHSSLDVNNDWSTRGQGLCLRRNGTPMGDGRRNRNLDRSPHPTRRMQLMGHILRQFRHHISHE